MSEEEPILKPTPGNGLASGSPERVCQQTAELLESMRCEIAKNIIGQDTIVEQLLATFVAGGHLLIEGKPGLGKTHLVRSLATTFGGHFSRIQFTPDLMPSDITGHTLFDMSNQVFKMRKGPVFTNLLLADEINRAPAKTQSALLEAMQELQVTIDCETLPLEPPFMVVATQNPIEHEGTYPLPEAQLDRFLMKVLIDYPEAEDEAAIVASVAAVEVNKELAGSAINQVATVENTLQAQRAAAAVDAVPEVVQYALNIVRATRNASGISLGAGTRGAISMIRVAKAYALLSSRLYVIPDDVRAAALPTLRHRVALAPEVAISGQTVDEILLALLDKVEAPRG